MEKLRPCPFCLGYNLKIGKRIMEEITWKHVECNNCGAFSKSIPKGYVNFDKVLTEKWNRRAYRHSNDN